MSSFEQARTLQAQSLRDLSKLQWAPREYLLHPWLRERDAALLYAPSGVGKSMVAMTLALAVAAGAEVFGWSAPRPRDVLYVDGEMDRADLVERFQSLAQSVNPEADNEAAGRLHILARDLHDPSVEFPDIGTVEGQEEVVRIAREVGASLVILDNLSTLATVTDENSAADMKKPMEMIQQLRQIGCATLLVHHSGKGGSGYRGSSMIETTFAWLMELTRSPRADASGLDVTLEWRKTRSGRNAATVPTRLRLLSGPEGTQWEHGEPEGLQAQRLVDAIRSCKFAKLADAAKSIGLGQSRGYEVLAQAKDLGLIDGQEAKECFEAAREAQEDAEEPSEF